MAADYGRPVYRHVGLIEVHPALAVHEEREPPLLHAVVAAALDVVVGESPFDRTHAIEGRPDRVDEPVSRGVLVVVQVPLPPGLPRGPDSAR